MMFLQPVTEILRLTQCEGFTNSISGLTSSQEPLIEKCHHALAVGLAIVEKTVSRMDGSFELSNANSGGLCANLRLQRATGATAKMA